MTTDTQREPLTRQRIVAAAVALADEHGLDALSMRKLGHALGVEAMSLYNHVAGKEVILDGMADYLFASVALPGPGVDWKESVRAVATSALEVFTRHPWAVPLLGSRTSMGEPALLLMDRMLGVLLEAGYPVEEAHLAWHVIASHVMGYAFQETNTAWARDDDHDHAAEAEFLRQAAAHYPNLAALAPHLAHCHTEAEFRFGLDVILDGLEARRP